MGKILKLGIIAATIGGAVYAWKKLMGTEGDYGDMASDTSDSSSSGSAGSTEDKQNKQTGA